MRIELWLLIIQLILLSIGIFVAKTRKTKQLVQLCSLGVVIAWSVYFGTGVFLKINVWLVLGSVALSFLLYLTSLFIVGTRFCAENIFPIKAFCLKGKLKKSFWRESVRNLYTSTYEELVYRWFLFNALYLLTESALLSIVIISILFFAVHIRKGIAVVQLIDIFVFAIIITVVFYYTFNPVYCIVIHIIRNQCVISQKYLAIYSERERMAKYMKLMKERNSK